MFMLFMSMTSLPMISVHFQSNDSIRANIVVWSSHRFHVHPTCPSPYRPRSKVKPRQNRFNGFRSRSDTGLRRIAEHVVYSSDGEPSLSGGPQAERTRRSRRSIRSLCRLDRPRYIVLRSSAVSEPNARRDSVWPCEPISFWKDHKA